MPSIRSSSLSHNWGVNARPDPTYPISVAVIRVPAQYILILILLKIAHCYFLIDSGWVLLERSKL